MNARYAERLSLPLPHRVRKYPRSRNTGVHELLGSALASYRLSAIQTLQLKRMFDSSAVLQSIACDYITCFARSANSVGSLHSLGSALFRHESIRGNRHKPFGMAGFKGFKCGEIEVGLRGEEVLVRAHGDAAAMNWKRLTELSENVSRIDLQATVMVQGAVTKTLEACRRAARLYADRMHKKPIVRWVCDHRGGYTLYLGARSSNCFGRAYDKWQKTKLDHYKECVRFEVQYQDRLALHAATSLCSSSSPQTYMSSYIQRFFENRGVPLVLPLDNGASIRCHRRRSDSDRNLEWIQTAVRPCVLRLIHEGRGEEVLTALGLVDDSSENVQAYSQDEIEIDVEVVQ